MTYVWTVTRTSAPGDWVYPGDAYVAYANPWNAGGMASGDWLRVELSDGSSTEPPEMRVTGELTRGSGLPKGAPTMIIGAHYNLESRVNPFTSDGKRGLFTAGIDDMSVSVGGAKNASANGEYFRAIQLYMTYERFTGDNWGGYAGKMFDIQIRLDTVNYPGGKPRYDAQDVMIGKHKFDVAWEENGYINGNAIHYQFDLDPSSVAVDDLDLDALIEFIRVSNNAEYGRKDAGFWLYQVASWIEPISGRIDATVSAPVLELDGRTYGPSAYAPSPTPSPEPTPTPTPTPAPTPAPAPPATGGGEGWQSVVVRAAGTGLSGDAPAFDVWVDGARRDGFSIVNPRKSVDANDDSHFRDYVVKYYGQTPDKIAIKFLNDGTVGGVDKNLWIDWVQTGGARYEAETDGLYKHPYGQSRTEGMWWNGEMLFDVGGGAKGGSSGGASAQEIVVRAAGTGAPGTPPTFSVRVDGVERADFAIANPRKSVDANDDSHFRDYVVKYFGQTPDKIDIIYDNDGQSGGVDRNLWIDWIQTGGARYEAETDGLYKHPYGQSRTEGMWWNGEMSFDLI